MIFLKHSFIDNINGDKYYLCQTVLQFIDLNKIFQNISAKIINLNNWKTVTYSIVHLCRLYKLRILAWIFRSDNFESGGDKDS